MPSISAIILARDSQRTIEACVKALLPAVDHVIVVDTGSTDDTVRLAQEAGARIYHFAWCDDFSAARNFGDSVAVTDWVIHVDSDEILRLEDVPKIHQLCSRFKKISVPVLVTIQQINLMRSGVEIGITPRLYKRGAFVWKSPIHEQLILRRGERYAEEDSDIGVLHDGYHEDIVDHRAKVLRNVGLLKKCLETNPDDVVHHFFLGRDLSAIGEFQDAIPHLQIAVANKDNRLTTYALQIANEALMRCLTSNR